MSGIDRSEEYPRYWEYDGEPRILLGGSNEDDLFQVDDFLEQLDALVEVGGNYVRCTMSSRDSHAVYPFARTGDGHDLEQLNVAYWDRFERFLDATAERDVVPQLEIWATFDYNDTYWEESPFNPANNVNYTAEESGLPTGDLGHPAGESNPFFQTVPALDDNELVREHQQRFVDAILDRTLPYDHVLYGLDNETTEDAAWANYWSDHLHERADAVGTDVNVTEMWELYTHDVRGYRTWNRRLEATIEQPERFEFVDIAQNNHNTGDEHYDNASYARTATRDEPRPLTAVKTYGGTGKHGTKKQGIDRFWLCLFEGIAAVRFHRPTSGIGIRPWARRQIESARSLLGRFDAIAADPTLRPLRNRSEDEAYCLAGDGEYAVLFPDGGRVGVDVSDIEGDGCASWLDTDAGEWYDDGVATDGDSVPLSTPDDGRWIAHLY
jgi:hypothetical protein